MNHENFEKEEKIIDLMKANLVGLKYFALFAVLFATPFYLIWKGNFSSILLNIDGVLLGGLLLLLLFLAESSFTN